MVASTGALKTVKATQIPSTCNPGPAPYDVAHYPGLRCNTKLCAIPCVAEEGDICNTVRAADSKVVPFDFAPIIGVKQGDTGSVSSVACKGSCGSESPNPLDVVDGRRPHAQHGRRRPRRDGRRRSRACC